MMVNCGEFLQHTISNLDGRLWWILSRLSSEKIGQWFAVNFYNTLLVIVAVNCGEFLHHTISKCDRELPWIIFNNTLLVISMVECREFNQEIKKLSTTHSEYLWWWIAVDCYSTLLVIVRMNCGEFLQHTLSNCDGELQKKFTTHS